MVRKVHGEWFRVNAGCFGCILGEMSVIWKCPLDTQGFRADCGSLGERFGVLEGSLFVQLGCSREVDLGYCFGINGQ